MRVAILSLMLLSAVILSGAGIYTASDSGAFQTVDGYGVNQLAR